MNLEFQLFRSSFNSSSLEQKTVTQILAINKFLNILVLFFQVKFDKASHINVYWKIGNPNDLNDRCETVETDETPENVTVTFETEAEKSCVFPFRYKKILYYGCTMLGEDPLILCATQTDKDFNAEKLGTCNEHCHRQRKSQFLIQYWTLTGSNPINSILFFTFLS